MMSFGQYDAEYIWRYGEHLRTDGGNICTWYIWESDVST